VAIQAGKELAALQRLQDSGNSLLMAFYDYLKCARGIFNNTVFGGRTHDELRQAASALFTRMADDLRDSDLQIDFRLYLYPAWMGDIALRGDVPEGSPGGAPEDSPAGSPNGSPNGSAD
jgi:hypothetical protein